LPKPGEGKALNSKCWSVVDLVQACPCPGESRPRFRQRCAPSCVFGRCTTPSVVLTQRDICALAAHSTGTSLGSSRSRRGASTFVTRRKSAETLDVGGVSGAFFQPPNSGQSKQDRTLVPRRTCCVAWPAIGCGGLSRPHHRVLRGQAPTICAGGIGAEANLIQEEAEVCPHVGHAKARVPVAARSGFDECASCRPSRAAASSIRTTGWTICA